MSTSGSSPRRRPSPAMIVAVLALFVALSGGAYAATVIPRNSVGTAQIKNNAVTWNKLAPGQIGHARVAQSQIQWRVDGTCRGQYQAIRNVLPDGRVLCIDTLPSDLSTNGLSDPLTSASAATVLASEALPGSAAYQLSSNPYLEVQGTAGDQTVTVSCEILAGTVNQFRSVSFALSPAHEEQVATLPLALAVPNGPNATRGTVGCVRSYTGTVAPKVQASAGLQAIQAQHDIVQVTPGTSTTALAVTTPTPTVPTVPAPTK